MVDGGLQPGPPSEVFGADDRLGASNYLQGLSLERLAKYLGPNAVAISLARKSRYMTTPASQGFHQALLPPAHSRV